MKHFVARKKTLRNKQHFVQEKKTQIVHHICKKFSKYICWLFIWIWCDFDRASSLIYGNKMPTRCNRGFYCRSFCLLIMFRAPLCPLSGAQEYYTVVALEARKCSAAQGPHSEVGPRAFWRLVSKSCDECKGSFARVCEAKRWSHWTCSSLGKILQPMRINSVPDVKCFCNNKNMLCAQ